MWYGKCVHHGEPGDAFQAKVMAFAKGRNVNYLKKPEENEALKGGKRAWLEGSPESDLQATVSAGSFLGVLLGSTFVLPQDQPGAVAYIPQSELGTLFSCPLPEQPPWKHPFLTSPLSPACLLGPVAGSDLPGCWNHASPA